MLKPGIRERLGSSRLIEIRNIVGVPEIAETSGVLRGTVYMWRYRYKTFPKPIVELRNGPLFDWQEVRAWLDVR